MKSSLYKSHEITIKSHEITIKSHEITIKSTISQLFPHFSTITEQSLSRGAAFHADRLTGWTRRDSPMFGEVYSWGL